MEKFYMLVKKEAGKVSYIHQGEWSIEMVSFPKHIPERDIERTQKTLLETEPRLMFSDKGEELSLPADIHRVSEINNAKPEAKFTIELIEIDMFAMTMTVVSKSNYDVKQWPNGHVLITPDNGDVS